LGAIQKWLGATCYNSERILRLILMGGLRPFPILLPGEKYVSYAILLKIVKIKNFNLSQKLNIQKKKKNV